MNIHDVPGDGNCLYNAVLYQMESATLSVDELRQMVAAYLESHSDTYTPSPVMSNSPYNADNEAPDDEDAYIASIPDPETQSRLTFESTSED